MIRNRLWKDMALSSAVLALIAAIALFWHPASAEPTITVYKSPT
jgi:hypothetical protein